MGDRTLSIVAGAAAALLGLLVMAGWLAGSSLLVQIRPEYSPMAFNTACGLVVCGTGLVLYELRWTVTASLLGVIAAAGGLATLVQYTFGVDLGLDRAFVDAGSTAGGVKAARMGTNAALEFVLFGAALLVAPILPLAANLFGALMLGAAAIPVFGYLAGVPEAIAWGSSAEISLHAAVAFLILGAGLVASARTHAIGQRSWRFAPDAIGVIVAVGVVLFWRTLDDAQSAQVRRTLAGAGTAIETEIVSELGRLGTALQIIAARPPDPAGEWQEDILQLRRSFPGAIALEWIDAAVERHRSTLPETAPETAPPPGEREREALELARSTREPVLAPAVRLETGDSAARMVVPRFTAARFDGFVSAVVRLRELVAKQLEGDVPDYVIELTADDLPVYRRGDVTSPGIAGWELERTLQPPGPTEWLLTIGPSPELVAAVRNPLPEIVLAVGVLLSLLLTATLRLVRTSAQRSEELAEEVERRRRAEGELRELAASLEQRVTERTEELRGANAALQVQNALRQSFETSLTRSNEDLKRFAAFVSHELRQPLATMDIWAQLLEAGSQADVSEKAQRQVAKIRTAIDRMTALIDNELALAQVLQQEPAMERVEVAALVGELATEMRVGLDAAGARLDLGELPIILADPVQMRRVFRNLIENALKFRRAGVGPVIRLEGEVRAGDAGRSECVIRVHDNGCGFSASQAEVIFEMFQRGDDTGVPGTGVGLAICRRIVERHGGSITAEGRPGEGATFTIVLPAERCEPSEVSAA